MFGRSEKAASVALLIACACFTEDVAGATLPSMVQDSTCVLQMTVSTKEEGAGAAAGGKATVRAVDPCVGEIKMPAVRTEITNNLGGLGPTQGPPVIHLSPFLELADGRNVDITIANLSEYSPNNVEKNGDVGGFLNVNIKAGFVDLLLTFTDTETGVGVTMPPFSMTIYDLDGPSSDPYAETVMIDNFDFTDYKLTDNTDVVASVVEDKTHFGSSKVGEGCDNPTSLGTLGTVVCEKSGTVDQAARSVALTMKGGVPNYHVGLRAGDTVTGRNFLLGIPAFFDKVCKVPDYPTQAPTDTPTASPTSPPTRSPTMMPTATPTASPTHVPTATPTDSPTDAPTTSPTSAPTGYPTFSPTDTPTASPTSAPTDSPTSTPTDAPTASPTYAPSHSPTSSPTDAPTSSPTSVPTGATSFGDPHVSNLKGERFEILQPDSHTFLVIPRGAGEGSALLHVLAKVEPFGDLCSGVLFVTGLRFSGQWLGEVESLDFSTRVEAGMDAEKAITMRAGSSAALNISEFRALVPGALAEVTELQPEEPQYLNQHVTTLQVKLMLGPSISKVWMVHQREKAGFSNSLWLSTSGLQLAGEAVGGILGIDEHDHATSRPSQCAESNTLRAVYVRSRRGSVLAEALA